jgi:mannose/fructose/N-acetylgalactosamine-specific phosphotransferase system component IID
MVIERHRGLVRGALIYLAVTIGWLAVWILVAPKGFYDGFPGGSTHWVSALPPYNEHLERDFGAAALGLTVLAALAALWMERRVVQAAAITLLVAGLPHLAFHLTTTERYSTADNVASITGLALDVLLPLALLYLVSDAAQRPAPRPEPASRGELTQRA